MGLGYIGLPAASYLASRGHRVLGVDVRTEVVQTINRGDVHIVEPELAGLVQAAVLSGNLCASLVPAEADIFVLAVPTPLTEGCRPDLSYVEAATEAIARHLGAGNLVILESTSPVGTTERVTRLIEEARPDLVEEGRRSFFVAHCPERVLPGQILRELVDNDRIVGGVDAASGERAAAFYRSFVTGQVRVTDARTAELTKLTENSFRDVNIAFANELSVICDRLGVDVWEVISLANRHPRVSVLTPGPGVGGHCLAVDPWFVVSSAPDCSRLIRTARGVNVAKEDWVIRRVLERASRFRTPVVVCLGLTYKPDIDDLRGSPALRVVRSVMRDLSEAEVLCVEPHLTQLDGVAFCTLEEGLRRADVVVGLVAHTAFKAIDATDLQEKGVVDACGLFH
ncbi:MAG: UDP-N-acetyl-D-mannosamine dehydrogenase [Rhodobacterales bacterium]|nr:UDP-N-acetyl-D-mannosamine dehydrogenase [Rhodobacterales bacterium]